MKHALLRKIQFALQHHGGKASLKEIYDYIEKSYYQLELDRYKDWKAHVNKQIRAHSSDSASFGGNEDLFYSTGNKGIWGLRQLKK
ncbi:MULTISPECIES: hypothetical protein [Exiguobacterium]|uniref:hypothetical protein n=1 Tax=Exiguobacterium TaxID=33986 RepID=UPI001BEA766E|nr:MULTISPECIES: hypothetical protein [Exiguobacterium]MCT4782496.1 hypothetical protein [Exiguobacterium himgiriensis]